MKRAKSKKSAKDEKLEKEIESLMRIAAHDSDVTVRQHARKDAAKLRLQLGDY